jgi:DNA-binding NarL/FixJ family response regulator
MIRLLIVADILLYAQGLRELLSRQSGFEVVDIAADANSAVALLRTCRPNLVLLDMALADGAFTARTLLDIDPSVKLVALAVPETEEYVVACAEAGVSAYVTREASVRTLVDTLTGVTHDELHCSAKMASSLFRCINKLSAAGTPGPPSVSLTSRELEVVELIDQGCSNKQIARRLSIEVATVKHHVHNLLAKLKVSRRGEAAARFRGYLLHDPNHSQGVIPH